MVANFDFARVSTAGPVFDLEKLDWLNGVYLRGFVARRLLRPARAASWFAPVWIRRARRQLAPALPDLQERTKRLTESPQAVSFFFQDETDYPIELLIPRKSDASEARRLLQAALATVEALPELTAETLEAGLSDLAAREGVRSRDALHADSRGRHGPHPGAAALQHAGGHRSRAVLRRSGWRWRSSTGRPRQRPVKSAGLGAVARIQTAWLY